MYPQSITSSSIPVGLCQCGCGQPTKLARKTSKRNGHIKGQPVRFIYRHQESQSLAARFWSKISMPSDPAACWGWNGATDGHGYGHMGAGGKHGATLKAHRVSWTIHFGAIPDGYDVCHHCDNPPCSNFQHLFLGTAKDNSQDASQKGRLIRAYVVKPQKLTWSDVNAIRQMYGDGVTQSMLASQFGCTQENISLILHNRIWITP